MQPGGKKIGDPLGRMPLLLRPLLIVLQVASITPCHEPSFGRITGFCR
jgi:hypothetical protein